MILGLVAASALIAGAADPSGWISQASGTSARLRGLAAVSDKVAWASGTGGTVIRTVDGGATWRGGPVAGAASLDFRDVHALDADRAIVLAIGPGDLSRVLRTADGGASWTTAYINPDPRVFLDAIAFWDDDRGLALGDPVDGRFTILTTSDGGRTWRPIDRSGMPEAVEGEGAFAASGTCLVVAEGGRAWFATGGPKGARVFRSTDAGRTWTAHPTPIRAGSASSGVFSIAFEGDGKGRGIAVGGDYKEPGRSSDVVAITDDGGLTWTSPGGPGPGGYRSAVAIVPGTGGRTVVAVGPTGSDVSADRGATWRPLDPTGFHAVGFSGAGAGWAVGDDGRVARSR